MPHNVIKIKSVFSVLVFLFLAFIIIVLIGSVLIPFLVALILTYILNPLVEKINHNLRIKRKIIALIFSIIIFLLFISIPLYLFPILVFQFKIIISNIPNFINLFNNNVLKIINNKYSTDFSLNINLIKDFLEKNSDQIYNHINIFSPIAKNSFVIIEIIIYTLLIPFILFYSINGWHKIINAISNLIPRSYKNIVYNIIYDIDAHLSAYFRGQLSVMIIMSIYYMTALYLIKLTSGIIIGFLTGLLVFIPYLGILTGLFIALCVGFTTNIDLIFYIFCVFIAGHVLEGTLITPYIVGGKIGLNPVMIILLLMVFGKLFGIIGVLLALPLSTITVVLLKHIKNYYLKSSYYNESD